MAEALLQIAEPGGGEKAACAGRVAGIDLGTTNSLIAIVVDGKPVCLPDEADRTLLPSVVHYDQKGQVIVGHEAATLLAVFPRDTIASVKRFMGRGPKDAEATDALMPYTIASRPTSASAVTASAREDANDDTGGLVRLVVAGGKREVTPVEVSAEILRTLADRARRELGGDLDGVVITVPAYFDDAQRQATKDAGRLAGLEVLRLVAEPTAAALAYGLDKQSTGTFAVYDLGGGTFDISILKLEGGVFEVKATGGDSRLGGDDFDHAIATFILEKAGKRGTSDVRLMRQATSAARTAKERLTSAEQAEIGLPDIGFETTLSRADMEKLVLPILKRTLGPCKQTLADAGIASKSLDGVILVGGATRMPLVRRFVEEFFGRPPLGDIDPDEVVALGAAVQAELLGGKGVGQDLLLLDVIPLSLGIETMGGVVEKLIPRNTTIPAGAVQTFTTFADKQTGFVIHVVQGERELVDQCRSLARFELTGIPPMSAGMARAEVQFLVDADGLLLVTARELTTGKEASIQVKPSYGLSDDEIDRMLTEAYAHGADDVTSRVLVEQRVEAERILLALRSALAQDGDVLSDEERATVDEAADVVARMKAGSDAQAIKQAVERLDHASQTFASRRMNRVMEKQMSGRSIEEIEQEIHHASD